MKLFIDTTNREKIVIRLDEEVFERVSESTRLQKLLEFLDETLQRKKVSLQDISEIEVNTGPGSFTGIRVGVTVAQTLGWSLGVSVNGKDMRKGETIEINYE